MADETKDFLIRVLADVSAARKSAADIRAVKGELQSLGDTGSQVNKKLADIGRLNSLDALGTKLGAAAAKTGEFDKKVEELIARLRTLGATSSEIDRATDAFSTASSGGGGGRTNGLTAIGTKIRSLPSTQIPGAGGLATDAIGNILRVLGALPPVALPVIAGLGAIAGALALMNKSLEEGRTALKAALEASNAYYKSVQELTSAQAKAQIVELEKANAALKAANEEQARAAIAGVNETTNNFSGLLSVLDTLNVGIGQGARALLLQQDGTLQVTDSIKVNTDEMKKNQIEIDRLSAGLTENAFAANDAAEAEKALAAIRDQLADEAIARYKRDQDLLRNATAEAVQKLIDGLTDENAAIQTILDEVERGARNISPEKLKEYNDLLAKNSIDIQDLTNNILGVAAARDAEKQAIKDQEAAMKDLQKVADDIANAEAKRQSDIEAINDRTAESMRKLKESLAEANKEAEIRARQEADKVGRLRADEDLKNQLDLQYKLSKVDEDISEAAIKAEIDRQEAIERVRAEFGRSSARAIQDRDAVALAAAEDKRNQDLAAAQKDYDKEIKQSEEVAEKKRKDILADYEHQRKIEALQRAAQDRERRIAEQNDSAARRRKFEADMIQLRNAQIADINARNAAYVKTISDLQKHLTDYKTAHTTMGAEVLKFYQKLKSDLTSILGGSGGSTGGGASLVPPGPITGPGGFGPTPNSVGSDVFGGFGAFRGAQANGLNIPINVAGGMSRAQVVQTVVGELNATLKAAGYN
jgi:hypothetical protein